MERTVIFIFVMTSWAAAEDNLSCCPPSTYLPAGSGEMDTCYDPITKATTPVELGCNATSMVIRGYSVEGDNVILIDEFNNSITLNSLLVCIGNETGESLENPREKWVSQVALTCPPMIRDQFYIDDVILGYCMMASTFFLILVVIIYSSFAELRDNFGKCIINYCGSLAVGLFLMSIMKFVIYRGENLCDVRGFSTYFFLVAAFFWSNSVSIYALTETWQINLSKHRCFQYKWYFLYSWGMPALLTCIMAIVNYIPGDHDRPGIGLKTCWFISLDQQWYYMFSVMSIILFINAVIFLLTLRVFFFQKRQGCYLKRTLQDVKFKIGVSVKLFFVLGLPWIFEMICVSMEDGHIAWALVSIFNSSQGIILFLILVVDRKKAVKLMAQNGWLCCCPTKLVEWYVGPLRGNEERADSGNNTTRALDLDNVSSDYLNPKEDSIKFIDKV